VIILKNQVNKIAVFAPCKCGSTSLETAFMGLPRPLRPLVKKSEKSAISDEIILEPYSKIYLFTRQIEHWYRSGWHMGMIANAYGNKVRFGKYKPKRQTFLQHLEIVKHYTKIATDLANDNNLIELGVQFPGMEQYFNHCIFSPTWIYKHKLKEDPKVELISLQDTENLVKALKEISPHLRLLHSNKSSNSPYDINREETGKILDIINTI